MEPDAEVLQAQEVEQLEEQLREAAAAENFFETASGKLITKLINITITQSVNKLSSDAYLKDHMGYVNEVSWLKANKQLLRKLQVASHPIRTAKIKERLEQYGQ